MRNKCYAPVAIIIGNRVALAALIGMGIGASSPAHYRG